MGEVVDGIYGGSHAIGGIYRLAKIERNRSDIKRHSVGKLYQLLQF